MKYKLALGRQLALDYCCSPEEVLDTNNHYSVYEKREGRRKFEEQDDCVLKVVVVNGKLLFTGKKEIMDVCREKYETCPGAWFMDVSRFRELDTILKPYGYQLKTAHPFFLPEERFNRQSEGKTVECNKLMQKEKYGFELKNTIRKKFCFFREIRGLTKPSVLMKNRRTCWQLLQFVMEKSLVWQAQVRTVHFSGRLELIQRKKQRGEVLPLY